MATPASEAPFVLPSVVFRPVVLLVVCGFIAAVVVGFSAWAGSVMFGVFFAGGLALGLLNALLVKWSVGSIAAQDHPLKRKVALNSATRLIVITVIALVVAYLFRPVGLGIVFGLAVFQVVLVLSTVLPVWQKLRKGEPDGAPTHGSSTKPVGE
jgi:hypothetical protein